MRTKHHIPKLKGCRESSAKIVYSCKALCLKMPLSMLEKFPSLPSLLGVLIRKGVEFW
jgi:hypothetical protein